MLKFICLLFIKKKFIILIGKYLRGYKMFLNILVVSIFFLIFNMFFINKFF